MVRRRSTIGETSLSADHVLHASTRVETDNRFTEARLAIGSGDNPSPLAVDLSRRRSGGVSGPVFW